MAVIELTDDELNLRFESIDTLALLVDRDPRFSLQDWEERELFDEKFDAIFDDGQAEYIHRSDGLKFFQPFESGERQLLAVCTFTESGMIIRSVLNLRTHRAFSTRTTPGEHVTGELHTFDDPTAMRLEVPEFGHRPVPEKALKVIVETVVSANSHDPTVEQD